MNTRQIVRIIMPVIACAVFISGLVMLSRGSTEAFPTSEQEGKARIAAISVIIAAAAFAILILVKSIWGFSLNKVLKRFEKPEWVFGIFLVVGLIFLIVGTVVCIYAFDYTDTQKTTAVITKIESYKAGKDTRFKTHITYEADGKIYNEITGNYVSTWAEGDEIEIYYDIDNPKNTRSKETDGVLFVIPALGLVFSWVGGIGLAVCIKRKQRM